MKQEISETAVTAASASGVFKAVPPVAVSGAFWAGLTVPELIQYLTLLWLLYQIIGSLWADYPKWQGRFSKLRSVLKKRGRHGKPKF